MINHIAEHFQNEEDEEGDSHLNMEEMMMRKRMREEQLKQMMHEEYLFLNTNGKTSMGH
jgi:hypothetical protein